jgi:hypothetical protein
MWFVSAWSAETAYTKLQGSAAVPATFQPQLLLVLMALLCHLKACYQAVLQQCCTADHWFPNNQHWHTTVRNQY